MKLNFKIVGRSGPGIRYGDDLHFSPRPGTRTTYGTVPWIVLPWACLSDSESVPARRDMMQKKEVEVTPAGRYAVDTFPDADSSRCRRRSRSSRRPAAVNDPASYSAPRSFRSLLPASSLAAGPSLIRRENASPAGRGVGLRLMSIRVALAFYSQCRDWSVDSF